MNRLKELLASELVARNRFDEVSEEKLDPIIVAREYRDEYISLICALFAYGNVKQIVKFLRGLDFSLLDGSEGEIEREIKSYYRFQTNRDVVEFFKTLRRFKLECSIEDVFKSGYSKSRDVVDGIDAIIEKFLALNNYTSAGYSFLISKRKEQNRGAYKRYNLFLRWMVRCDNIDLGLWSGVSCSHLLVPLDTHILKVSKELGLLNRSANDLTSARIVTKALLELDSSDPLKYDFLLYRTGQEKKIGELKKRL